MHEPATAIVDVDLAALGRNFDCLAARANGAEMAPVLKADAYGIGSALETPVTDYLHDVKGVRTCFVATFAEASSLRHVSGLSGMDLSVYALNGYAGEPRRAERREATPVLSSTEQARQWTQSGGGRCGLSLDIGMERLGFDLEGARSLSTRSELDPQTVDLVVMHLSHAGDVNAPENARQAARYGEIAAALRDPFPRARFSLSNSGGLLAGIPADQQVVRPGYALYGGAPSGNPEDALEPVATFTAPVIVTRQIDASTPVGYDGRWVSTRPSRLAILGAGYADGVLRSLTNSGRVWLGGAACPIVGAVSMDLTTIDVTDCPEPVSAGDRAEFFGTRIRLDEQARRAGTIGYELLTSLGPRVVRRYSAESSGPKER